MLAFLVLLLFYAQGWVIDEQFHQSPKSEPFIDLGQFIFRSGGTLNLTIQFNWEAPGNKTLTFFVCNDQHLEYIRYLDNSFGDSLELSCYLPALDRCTLVQELISSPFQFSKRIESTLVLNFFISNCGLRPVSIHVSGIFQNPEPYPHLSDSETFMPNVYQAYFAIWAVLLTFVSLNAAYFRNIRFPLHRYLCFTILFKMVGVIFDIFYWIFQGGHGYIPAALKFIHYSFWILSSICCYLMMLLAAKGYGITRTYLYLSEKTNAIFMVLTLALLEVLCLTNHLKQENLALFLVVFILFAKYLNTEINSVKGLLSDQLNLLEESAFFAKKEQCQPLLKSKKHLFLKLQIVFGFFVPIKFSSLVLSKFLLAKFLWIQQLLVEATSFCVIVGIAMALFIHSGVLPQKHNTKRKVGQQKLPLLVIQNPMSLGENKKLQPCVQFGAVPEFQFFEIPSNSSPSVEES